MALISKINDVSKKGYPQIIESFKSANGKNYLKVIETNLGRNEKSKRVIAYKSNGPLELKATKVIDDVYGQRSIYTRNSNGEWKDQTGAVVSLNDKTIAWG